MRQEKQEGEGKTKLSPNDKAKPRRRGHVSLNPKWWICSPWRCS